MAKHNYHEYSEINIENSNNITPVVYSTLIIALLLAVAYVMTHITQEFIFLVSNGLFGYSTSEGFVQPDSKFISNISNLGYLFQGIIMVCLPLNFLVGQKNSYVKIVLLKILLLLMAFTYIMGEAWILKWIYMGIFKGPFNWDVLQFQKDNAYMFNHMAWGSNNGICIIFDLLAAGCWYLTARNINNDYKNTTKSLIYAMIVTFGLPMMFFAIRLLLGLVLPGTFKHGLDLIKEIGLSYLDGEYNAWWYTKSAFFLMYLIVMAFFFHYTSQNQSRYEEYVCEIGDLKTVISRNKRNYISSKLSNLFGNDARKYYKDEMKKNNESDKKQHKHRDNADFKSVSQDTFYISKVETEGDTAVKQDNKTIEYSVDYVKENDVNSVDAGDIYHYHYNHSSSSGHHHHSSGDGHHHSKHTNWQPVTQNFKNGIGNDSRGAMGINEILQQQGAINTNINSLTNDVASNVIPGANINHPGITLNSSKSGGAGVGSTSIEEMIRMQQMQQAAQVQQAATTQQQIQQLQAQLQALQQQQQFQQIQQLQQQIADLQHNNNQQ